MKDKPYNSGQWTTARFRSFIKGALRSASMRWGPKHVVRKEAWRARGIYLCVGYKRRAHKTTASLKEKGKRVNNVFVDHILPVIDPEHGFTGWDDYITNMFCEEDNLQVLCRKCHKEKTNDERK